MKQKAKFNFLLPLLVLVVAGCVGDPPAPDVGHQHPGNMHADASPLPSLETGLLNFTNVVVVQPTRSQPDQEHQHDHKK